MRRSRARSSTTVPWNRAPLAKLLQALDCFPSCGANKIGEFLGVYGCQEVFSAGEGLLAFDLGAESRLAGA